MTRRPKNNSGAAWRWRPSLLGLAAGWLAGAAWWAGLMIAFGPSVEVSGQGERTISVASRVAYAPLAAAPWAVVGLVVGAVATVVRGPWVPLGAGAGTLAGGAYSLATSLFDGWLALTMPVYCLGGALAGLAAGVVARACWQLLAGQVHR